MSIAAAAKAIQKEHRIPRELALSLARDTAATMPGDPPTQAIVAETRYIMRRVREGKPTSPLGSGMRFRRQIEAILTTFRDRGEAYEGKAARGRASAMAARQMRDAFGDEYVQYLASVGKTRAKVERAAEAEGKLVRLPRPAAKPRREAAPLRRANPAKATAFARDLAEGLGKPEALKFARSEERRTKAPFWKQVHARLKAVA